MKTDVGFVALFLYMWKNECDVAYVSNSSEGRFATYITISYRIL